MQTWSKVNLMSEESFLLFFQNGLIFPLEMMHIERKTQDFHFFTFKIYFL